MTRLPSRPMYAAAGARDALFVFGAEVPISEVTCRPAGKHSRRPDRGSQRSRRISVRLTSHRQGHPGAVAARARLLVPPSPPPRVEVMVYGSRDLAVKLSCEGSALLSEKPRRRHGSSTTP
jgi:hypothetical protein